MPQSPPKVSQPPIRTPFVGRALVVESVPAIWMEEMYARVGGATGRQIIGQMAWFEATIGQGALASGGEVTVLDALSGEQWKVRGALLSGAGTNFSGGSGDRALSITDGTSTWSVIPAATLQSLAAARWGDTALPFPATVAHMMTASVAGADIVAKYSGGANDYTAGSLTLAILAERTA